MPGRLTAEDFLDVWRRSLDPSYTRPIEEAGPGHGLEVYQAHAAIMARVAEAIDVTTQATFILPFSGMTNPPAQGAAYATVTLDLARTRALNLAVRVRAAEVLFVDALGRTFTLGTDLLFAAGAAASSAEAVATRVGYGFNVPKGTIVGFVQPGSGFTNTGATVAVAAGVETLTDTGAPDALVPAHVGQYVLFTAGANVGAVRRVAQWQRNPDGTNTALLADDEVAHVALVAEVGAAGWRVLDWVSDLGFTVVNPEASSGGRSGMLDALGRERNIPRATGEADDTYRQRVATLPDVVSPNAIRRVANRVLAALGPGVTVVLREAGTACLPGFYLDVDAFDYDDVVRPADRFKLLVDLAEMRGFFLLGVPKRNDGDFGLFFDLSAGLGWEVADGFYDAGPHVGGFWDGFPSTYWLGYLIAIYGQVDLARAAGVGFDLYLIKPDDPAC